jgi:hypothetical protein
LVRDYPWGALPFLVDVEFCRLELTNGGNESPPSGVADKVRSRFRAECDSSVVAAESERDCRGVPRRSQVYCEFGGLIRARPRLTGQSRRHEKQAKERYASLRVCFQCVNCPESNERECTQRTCGDRRVRDPSSRWKYCEQMWCPGFRITDGNNHGNDRRNEAARELVQSCFAAGPYSRDTVVLCGVFAG